jgi:ribosomal protein S18 acetylase RimI-like enzyme
MPPSFRVETARPEEWAAALRLVFQDLAEEVRSSRVANALDLIHQGEIDPAGITVARGNRGLVGAMVSVLLPGASGLVWPPGVLEGPARTTIEDALVGQARHRLRQGGAKLAQAILAPTETPLAAPLLRNGFRHVTALWYMRRELDVEAPGDNHLSSHQDLPFQDYAHGNRALFPQTLLRTYQGTLDCPELNGVRDIEEILEGHRRQGKHDPGLWWLLFQAANPVGILLLTEMPEWGSLDISYLGVVPEVRGRGLGRALTAKALAEARRVGVGQLTLAVDGRNLPAQKTYLGRGFQLHELREVYLSFWEKENPGT